MFSLCISNEKKFNHSTKGTLTVVPVYVEFGSIYSLKSSSNSDGNQKIESADAGIELLHTVAGLYYKNLPNIPLNIIYESLCKEGVKTLLLLRHGEEILKEWKDELKSRKNVTTEEQFLDKKESIGTDFCSQSKLASPDELTCSSISSGFPSKETWSPSIEEISILTSSCSKTFSSGIISDLEDECEKMSLETEQMTSNNLYHENNSESKLSSNISIFSKDSEARLQKENVASWSQTPTYRDLEAKIERCFDDDYDDKSTSDDGNWSKTTETRLTELLKSGEKFLNSVNERKIKRISLRSPEQLDLSHVAIEHRVIGAISFHKDYRLPSMPIIFIDWLIVRDSYRHSKIGSYLVKKIKSSSLVGSYHLMCVNSLSTEATRFFRSLGFIQDDISECRLRPLLSRKMVSPVETSLSTLLFYYPSYRVNSVSMFSNDSLWFDVSLKSISDEIDFWRERSVESYHDQITLVLRLKSEIVKLHNQLRQRDKQLKEIKQENKELRHIVTQSNAMAAISTIDELGSLFESIKDLCSVVR